jgi:hypothetical protein
MASVGNHNQWTQGSPQTTVTANMIVLTVANKPIGRAQNASSRVDYGTQGVYEIGSIYPAEHVYTKYEGTVTLERVMLIGKSLADMHLAPLGEDVLGTGTVNIVIKNKDNSNKVICAYIGCTAQNYSMEVRANNMVSETVNMTYLTASLVDKQ